MTPSKPVKLEMYRGTTFGPIIFICKNNGIAVPLAGCTPYLKARSINDPSVTIDLEPTILDPDTDGKVQLFHADEDTPDFPADEYNWDLLFEFSTGQIRGPYAYGSLKIKDVISLPE